MGARHHSMRTSCSDASLQKLKVINAFRGGKLVTAGQLEEAMSTYINADNDMQRSESELNAFNRWGVVTVTAQNAQALFEMYAAAYEKIGARIKNAVEFAEKYRHAFVCHKTDTNQLLGFMCYELTPFGFKLNLSATLPDKDPLSDESKQLVQNKKARLLVTPGYYQEASEASSWILRSKYNLSPIRSQQTIQSFVPGYEIELILPYENRAGQEVYRRSKNGVTRTESLFGLPCKHFYKLHYQMERDPAHCTLECSAPKMRSK